MSNLNVILAEIILNKKDFSYEYRLIKKDGSICHVETNGKGYRDKKSNETYGTDGEKGNEFGIV